MEALTNFFSESFSTNLYEEISISSLQQEYNKTVFEILDYRIEKKKPPVYKQYTEIDYRSLFRQKLIDKLKNIKTVLHRQIKQRELIIMEKDIFHGWAPVTQQMQDDLFTQLRLNQT